MKQAVLKIAKASVLPLALILVIVIVMNSIKRQDLGNPNYSASYSEKEFTSSADGGELSRNEQFTLSWDNEVFNIILTDNKTGQIWSTIPYEYYKSGEYTGRARVMMFSPIFLDVYSKSTQNITTLNGYNEVLQNGRTDSVKIKNGIKITYWFDSVKIGIPVSYTLAREGLRVEILTDEIVEGDEDNFAWQVSVTPYLASSECMKSDSNYLFIPSGEGALMYTDIRGKKSRVFSAAIYGDDPIVDQREQLQNEIPVKLPVFGASSGNKAICVIVESGAARAEIRAEAGNQRVGYSNIYASFKLRGYNNVVLSYAGKGNVENLQVQSAISSDEAICILYSPVTASSEKEVSAYTLMAKQFSNWLIEKYDMDLAAKDRLLSLEILGGIQETRYALGIPYQSTTVLTTFDSAQKILSEMLKISGGSLDAQLLGFGESGLDHGKIAGGFSFSSAAGNEKKLLEFSELYNIPLYFDYDLIRYNSRGNGYSKADAAYNSTPLVGVQKNYLPSIRSVNNAISDYWLLGRVFLLDAAEKLVAKTKKLTGISLSTLGSIAYSDYNEQAYPLRKSIEEDASSIIKDLQKQGKEISVSSANGYAAANSNKIFDAPVISTQSDSFDLEIPFYQIVFKGYVSLSNTPINAAARPEIEFLKAVQTGSGLCFSVYANERPAITGSENLCRLFYCSDFEDNKQMIKEMTARAEDYFKMVSGAKINNHLSISKNVTRTDFDNGVSVYVNFGDSSAETPAGTIQPFDFAVTEG